MEALQWQWFNVILDVKELGIMRYIISGKNIDVTEGLKNSVYDKIG